MVLYGISSLYHVHLIYISVAVGLSGWCVGSGPTYRGTHDPGNVQSRDKTQVRVRTSPSRCQLDQSWACAHLSPISQKSVRTSEFRNAARFETHDIHEASGGFIGVTKDLTQSVRLLSYACRFEGLHLSSALFHLTGAQVIALAL